MIALEIGRYFGPDSVVGEAANEVAPVGRVRPSVLGEGAPWPLELVALGEELLDRDEDEVSFWRDLIAGSAHWRTGTHATATWEKLLAGSFVQLHSARTAGATFVLLRAVEPEAVRPLAPYQLDLLEGVAAGKASKVLAFDSGMTEAAASARLKVCLNRLGLRSRAELQWFCRESGTLAPPSTLAVVSMRVRGVEFAILRFSRCAKSIGAPFPQEEGAVVAGVLAGMSNDEIARARGSSANTVKNQVANAMKRVGAGSRFELIANSCSWAPAADVSERLPASVAHVFLQRLNGE